MRIHPMTYNVGHQFFHAPVTGLVIHPVVPFAQIATLHDHISGTQVVITRQLPKIAENICGAIPVELDTEPIIKEILTF